jgi:hypothetical protein
MRGGACRRRIVGGRRRKADWLTMRLVLLLAVCAIESRDLAMLHSKAQAVLAVASSSEIVAAVVKDGHGPAWAVSPFILGLGRQWQRCCALSTHATSSSAAGLH